MKRFFRILIGALAMITVALLSAFITMRLAIHGREVQVPDFSGLTLPEATAKAEPLGLNLSLENTYYSAVVPAGRVLQQYPAPGARVRRAWLVRITQSLGPQKVAIPDVTGMPQREAAVKIRRGLLEMGAVAHLPVPGDAERVLAQSPPPNAEGVDKPSVSLLLSEPEQATRAWVMPNLNGMPLIAAGTKISAMGLHIAYAQEAAAPTEPVPQTQQPATSGKATVIAQSPAAGSRVTAADSIKLTIVR